MPVPTLRLTKAQANALLALCTLKPEQLSRITGALDSSQGPVIVSPAILRRTFATELEISAARAVTRLVVALSTVARRNFSSLTELMAGVESAVNSLEWDKDQRSSWSVCRSSLERILSSRQVKLTAKAIDLIYDFPETLIGARILTDVRPIFDDDKSVIVGASVTQTLRVDFGKADGNADSISLALDANDIQQLQRSCADALQKIEVARKHIEQWGMKPLTVTDLTNDRE